MALSLHAHTANELRYYLMVTSCEKCGQGPLVARAPEPTGREHAREGASREGSVRTRCKRCGHRRTLRFRWEYDVPAEPGDADCINASDRPSHLIDLAQWVGLYTLFAEAAESARDPAEARANACQAALCLAEALKFHGGEELPPDAAFFREASRAAYRANPANFARTRLRELQALLPAAVGRGEPERAEEAEAHVSQPWWHFW